MNSKNNLNQDYLEKLNKFVPKNLIIEEVTEDKKKLVNDFLKSRKNLEFNFTEINPHFGNGWNYKDYPYGSVMKNTKNNKIVGFLATIYSRRKINNKDYTCCNLAHFYIEKEFRIYAYAFFLHLLKRENTTIYSHTPKDTIVNMYRKLNFEIQKMKYTIGFGINFNSIFSKNFSRFKIIKDKNEVKNILNLNDKKIFEDHNKYNCSHFVILDNKKILDPCYFVVKKIKKYQIKIIDILYISNLQEYSCFAPEIFTKISFLFKAFLIGQRYFKEEEKLKNNFSFFSQTVEKYVPIKRYKDFYVFDTLYSDYVLFD
tara:strand:+ start:2675 stop:3616 length:942 start_codon:yes stop_codon:yes gene_type:complete